MPPAIQCPGCAARLTVADPAGTVVKCPKCGTAMTVPAVAPNRPSLRLKTPPPQPSPIEDDDPPPRPHRRPVNDADDRPPRRRVRDDDHDEDDDRPARRRRKPTPAGPPVWVSVAAGGGALVLLAAVGVAAFVLIDHKEPEAASGDGQPTIVRPGEGGGLLGTAAPAGWSEVRDDEGGYRVYLPGTASRINFGQVAAANAAQGTTGLSGYACTVPLGDPRNGPPETVHVRVISLIPPPDKVPGPSAEQLYEAVKGRHPVMETFEDVLERRPVTLGGKPGLLVVTKKKGRRTGVADDPNVPDWARQQEREHEAKEAAARKLHYVTTDGKRVVFIEVEAPADPDPALLKTLTDSFLFA